MKYFLSVDLGGTKTAVALFTQNGKLVDDFVYFTASCTFDGEEAVYINSRQAMEYVLNRFHIVEDNLMGIGVGCPGPLDPDSGIILNAPLMGWINFPLKSRLMNDFHVPVTIDNDCNLGALAEQRCGLAKGKENVIYVTVSTGVGAGIVIGGKIYHGKSGGAGEFGHLSIDIDGMECPCGSKGCLELYCSGTAIKEKLLSDFRKGTKALVFTLAEGKEENLNAGLLAKAAKLGDSYSLCMYRETGTILGYGIANLFNLFAPDVIIIGGGVSKSHALFENAMRKSIKEHTIGHIDDGRTIFSEMCDRAVLYGAYYLISEKVKGE